VKTGNVMGPMLMDINTNLIPDWQQNLKRLMDVVVSITAIPLSVLCCCLLALHISSPGSIIYSEVATRQKDLRSINSRSMYVNAEEKNGPALSDDNDPRITKWGKVMRKWRLDELPQLWNIITGDI